MAKYPNEQDRSGPDSWAGEGLKNLQTGKHIGVGIDDLANMEARLLADIVSATEVARQIDQKHEVGRTALAHGEIPFVFRRAGAEQTTSIPLGLGAADAAAAGWPKVATTCSAYSTLDLLQELSRRGGHPGALADAAILCIKKSQDYNHGRGSDPHTIDRTSYFPFGAASYAQMLHTKAERFTSITKKTMDGGASNFEGLHDTAFDIINYAGFFLADKRLK